MKEKGRVLWERVIGVAGLAWLGEAGGDDFFSQKVQG